MSERLTTCLLVVVFFTGQLMGCSARSQSSGSGIGNLIPDLGLGGVPRQPEPPIE